MNRTVSRRKNEIRKEGEQGEERREKARNSKTQNLFD
jgi:hypothetical protein